MLPLWLSSWYQQQQVQEPFNDQYEAAAGEDGDWVEVITPSTKRRQPQQQHKTLEKNAVETTTTSTNEPTPTPVVVTTEPVVKGLSRQERRANAHFQSKKRRSRHVMQPCL
ncbi:unnamed protein product [Mucor hiemalis]